MLRSILFLSTTLAIGAAAHAQTAVNAKILHNVQHTDVTSRVAPNTVDTIYYMQPSLTRTGYGMAKGWRVVLQDADFQSAEAVQFAFVPYASDGQTPDVSPGAVIANATANLQFPQPPQGSISAAQWTLTLATAVTVPSHSGLRIVLPLPANPSDGVTVWTQRGRTSQLPVTLRKQLTYFLSSGQAAAFWEAGSTVEFGGIYVEPVTQMFVNSNRYGPREDLFGLEAVYPSAAAGDQVGFQMIGERFRNQVAVLLLAGGTSSNPVASGFGTLFLLPPFGLIQLPFALDASGVAKSPTVAVPAGLKLWTQTAFVHLQTGLIRMSDATGIESQQ